MHPVLKSALEPLAEVISRASRDEIQAHPQPGSSRWCAQQVIEHLILTYELTSTVVSNQLKTGRLPKARRSALEFVLRMQTIGFGHMPEGIPTIRAFRPTDCEPEDGQSTAARFRIAAEEMDGLLVAARKKFGIQICGEHPIFGPMRVDEWRRYHAVHADHHRPQLLAALRYARTQAIGPAARVERVGRTGTAAVV